MCFHQKGKKNWVSNVCDTLYKFGFGFVWESRGVGNVRRFLSAFKQRLFDCHLQDLDSALMTKDRYTFYSSFRQLDMPDYLIYVKNPIIRKYLTRIRLGVSQLKIHRYRHTNRHVSNNCPFCPDVVETEIHFILVCPYYKTLRELYIPLKYFRKPNAFKLTLLLSNNRICTAVALFLSKAFRLRNQSCVCLN